MFQNKSLLVANIAEVYLTIHRIYYVTDYVFGKCPLKHDRNIKINPR
jgi:hypothetical protein